MLTPVADTSQDTPTLPRAEAPAAPAEASTAVEPAVGAAHVPAREPAINAMFRRMFELKASDLHLSSTVAPLVRKDGEMRKLHDAAGPLTSDMIMRLLSEIMASVNKAEFEARHDTDFAYEIAGLARFRANVFMDRQGVGAVFRVIPSDILTAEQLGLSPHVLNLCALKKGLVLVTGPTGSGKSTTLSAMIDHVNKTRADHIITIEDPIEFVHPNQKCLINQREVHNHTRSFKDALRAALREDPDVILVGELRDLETIAIAIETAETGHLVFGTLHTTTAASTVDRVIDQFPSDRQAQIRVMLSESLRGVIAQTLCRKVGGGRAAALEVLIINSAISNLIREGKTFQIPSMMQVGRAQGMVTLNDALMDLVKKGTVTAEEAASRAVDKAGFELLLKRK
jgi:twitching motility protein PilT